MPMPRPKLSVRGLMALVAIVGISLWADRMLRVRSSHLIVARRFADEEALMEKAAATARGGWNARVYRKRAAMSRGWRLYHLRLARYPWLPDDAGSPGRRIRP